MEISTLLFPLFTLSLTLLLLTLTKTRTTTPRNSKKVPPSPPYSLPVLGHLHLLLKPPLHRTLAGVSATLGPIVSLKLGFRRVVVVSSPALAEECFTKHDVTFANRPHLLVGKHMGNNYSTLVWAPYGPHWRNLRRIAAVEILSGTRVGSYAGVRAEEVRALVRRMLAGGKGAVEMKTALSEVTMNVMMMMVAGRRYCGEGVGEEEARGFRENVTEVMRVSGASNAEDFVGGLRWVSGMDGRILRMKERRDRFLQGLIQEHREKRMRTVAAAAAADTTSSNINNNIEEEMKNKKKKKSRTLIDVLLGLQDTDPEYHSDQMICGTISVLLAAGIDTSAAAMEWTMALLLNHPHVLRKAQAEIDAHVPQTRLLAESDIPNLPYLNSIIAETFRMYPVGPLLVPHESTEDCVLGGYHVPRGTMLLVNMWAIHNDPKVWDHPREFRPERFLGLEAGVAREGFKLLPFGSGRRSCPGEGLAMRVVGLVLGTLIQCFEWERVGEELVDMSEGAGLTMPKARPLEAKCRPRAELLHLLSQL